MFEWLERLPRRPGPRHGLDSRHRRGFERGSGAGAAVSTSPTSTTTQTSTTGTFTLSSIPIGAYTVRASKTGFQSAQLTAVGVAAGATNQVTIALAPSPNAPGSIAGTVLGRVGTNQPSSPVSGAMVCPESSTAVLPCTTSQSDGTFVLAGVAPGPVYLTAAAAGFLTGETTTAVIVAPDGSATGVSITLSGSPSATATYVGAARCVSCHIQFDAGLTAAWQHSAHAGTVSHTLDQLDLNGWPAAPATCAAPNIINSQVQATEPVSGKQQNVLLVRWAASCPGEPQFSMAFDANGNGLVDPGETVIPVQGTQGGIATDGGQCGQGGLLPLTAYNQNAIPALIPVPCSANFLSTGATPAQGYWQQEYLVNIGSGAAKPAWVSWDTTGTPQDMLALPLAWNQRAQYWANAPDYNPTQGGTFAKVCAGCHDTGPGLTVDGNANVTTYVAGCRTSPANAAMDRARIMSRTSMPSRSSIPRISPRRRRTRCAASAIRTLWRLRSRPAPLISPGTARRKPAAAILSPASTSSPTSRSCRPTEILRSIGLAGCSRISTT